MFACLGNKHDQEVIRQLNPQPKGAKQRIHCKLLEKNPSACNDTPLPGGGRGVCPHNPHHPKKVAEREKQHNTMTSSLSKVKFDEYMSDWLTEIGMRVSLALSDNLIRDLDSLTPLEYTLGSYFRHVQQINNNKALSEYTAKLIAAYMMGGKLA